MKNKTIKLFAICMSFSLLIPTYSFANEQVPPNNDLTVKIGNEIIDVEKLAEENDVDAYALKEAIEKGMDAEKASPWSNLPTFTPNAETSESIDSNSYLRATKVNKSDQDSTAYVAASGAKTASGKTPAVGMCAMHQDVTTKTGSTSSTMVKLGTTITTTSSVNINGTSRTSFVVEDRGAPDNRTKYWVDFYFGEKTDATYKAAINYGVKTVSYSYSY